MMNKNFGPMIPKIIIASLFTFLLIITLLLFLEMREKKELSINHQDVTVNETPQKRFKILHVMSYHSPWQWTDDQFNGFKDALKGLNIEYEIFQMDTKRRSSPEWKLETGKKARDLIDTWKPDLVYTSDDIAQEYVAKYYVNSNIPIVFSAVNADPNEYGFVGSKNITGILEEEHFVESVRLLKEIDPNVKKIAVILDDEPEWKAVVKRMKAKLPELPDIEIINWDIIYSFEEYQNKIKGYQDTADALAIIGVSTFKNKKGNNVPFEQVLGWTAKNSSLPDFSFWSTSIPCGTLCAVTISGYEQGFAAGKIARGILMEGRTPSSYPMEPTKKGQPVISLARAKKLGIKIKTSILLSAQIFEKFECERF